MTDSKIQGRIRALLNQAQDQQGTPEGKVFEQKAFELLAKYGLTEFDLGDSQEELQQMVSIEYSVQGKYPREKQSLLTYIGHSLGCFVVRERGSVKTRVAGNRRNVDRTLFLYELLVLQAYSESMKLKGDHLHTTQQVRHSFWVGYAMQIGERLSQAEKVVHDQIRQTSSELVPVNDLALAKQHFLDANAGVRVSSSRSRSRLTTKGLDGGREAANRADINQTRVQNRRALT